jgi:hypothetical protein
MSVETACRSCGRAFEATRDDVVRGVWRDCPACRPAAATLGSQAVARPPRATGLCERCGSAVPDGGACAGCAGSGVR